MKKLKIISLFTVILICFSVLYCKKSSTSSDGVTPFILKGYVELDGERVPNVNVKFEFGEGSANAGELVYTPKIKQTDSKGEFEFRQKVTKVQAKYFVCVQHPLTGAWTSKRGGTALNGKTATEPFILASQ